MRPRRIVDCLCFECTGSDPKQVIPFQNRVQRYNKKMTFPNFGVWKCHRNDKKSEYCRLIYTKSFTAVVLLLCAFILTVRPRVSI